MLDGRRRENNLPPLTDRREIAAAIRDAFATLWPGRFAPTELTEDVSLGKDGLGLDSIDIVELALACEERVGQRGYDLDALLESRPVTIGRVIDHLAA
jgi:acyl carrier protein